MTAESAARSLLSSSAPWKTEFDELWQLRHSFVPTTACTDAKPVLLVGPVPPFSSLHATAASARPRTRIAVPTDLMALSNRRNKADVLTTTTEVGMSTDHAKSRRAEHVVFQQFGSELGFIRCGLSQ